MLFYNDLDLNNQKILCLPSIFQFERTVHNLSHPKRHRAQTWIIGRAWWRSWKFVIWPAPLKDFLFLLAQKDFHFFLRPWSRHKSTEKTKRYISLVGFFLLGWAQPAACFDFKLVLQAEKTLCTKMCFIQTFDGLHIEKKEPFYFRTC